MPSDQAIVRSPAHDEDLILGAVEYLTLVIGRPTLLTSLMMRRPLRNIRLTEEHGWLHESDLDFTGPHAWNYRGNPAKVFHSTNPTVD